MGGSHYSQSVFDKTYSSATAGGASYFARSTAIQKGEVAAHVHEKLDPSKPNKAGKLVRESRDSVEHPVSNAIACIFDTSGSMKHLPEVFVKKLGALMSILTKKGYISDPQVLFAANSDSQDAIPLQIGQFESGNEMDEALSLMATIGGGAGPGDKCEAYELVMYYMARHASMDCFEKRGKKGYLFFIGDEKPYDVVSAAQVKRLIGDDLTEDIPTKTILKELREKFNVYWIYPKEASYFDDKTVMTPLNKMFGENLIALDNAEEICETIAATIGVAEGLDVKSIEADLVSLGSSKASAKAVLASVSP